MGKLLLAYQLIKTNLFYGLSCLSFGKRVIIINPILITARHIKFGSKILIRDNARIEGVAKYGAEVFTPVIDIKSGVTIEQNLHLTCAKHVTIGENTAVAANVTISDINHNYKDVHIPPEKQPITVLPVTIGNDCKIYNNAVILPGTILGKHCIVGANSVVRGNTYHEFSVIVGSPARVIKRYSFEKEEWIKTDSNGNFL